MLNQTRFQEANCGATHLWQQFWEFYVFPSSDFAVPFTSKWQQVAISLIVIFTANNPIIWLIPNKNWQKEKYKIYGY